MVGNRFIYILHFFYIFCLSIIYVFFRIATKQFFNILIDIKESSSKTRAAVVGVGDAGICVDPTDKRRNSSVFNERKLSE